MKKLIVALAVLTVAMLAPLPSQAHHEGCYVLGELQGLTPEITCSYVAKTDAQSVYVGTPYDWRVWVLRQDDRNQPVDVTLANGTGPVAGAPPQVRPIVGETVYVTMSYGRTGPFENTIGFVAAGIEQAHP
ncbi:MAG TPA: hypothetical protein VM600_06000 [Actinomycetota bacterium]|nr:hypothetical protein [Actinomycetota bacterium]